MSSELPKKPPPRFILPPRPKAPGVPEYQQQKRKEGDPPKPQPLPNEAADDEGSSAETAKPKGHNPLLKFSLRGRGSDLALQAADAKPVFGEIFMRGELSMLYGAANVGKTLIMTGLILQGVEAGRIDPKGVWIVNADDSSHGLAGKVKLAEEAGVHMVAPGHLGFRMSDLPTLLDELTERGFARDTCIIIDTLKKAVDLMNKNAQGVFIGKCRPFVQAGGTIIALGHTRKHPAPDGTPVPQGTNDVMEDFDAVYVAVGQTSKVDPNDRVVVINKRKSRAPAPETVAYAYSVEDGLSYDAKLASVRPIPIDELDDYAPERYGSEPLIMDALFKLITVDGSVGKMALAAAAAKQCGVSRQQAVETIERCTGTNPREHLWTRSVGTNGRFIYVPLEKGHGDSG